MTEDLEFAIGLARNAGDIMREKFVLGINKEWKEDLTPVTAADIEINELVMQAVQEKYPSYSFIGEEGSREIESEYTWVCDPIDGTIPFSHGIPTFAFSLALIKNGESILGVIYDPLCDRLLHAEKDAGSFLNGDKISVSKDSKLQRTTYVEIGGYTILPKLQESVAQTGCQVLTHYSAVYAGLLVATGQLIGQVYKGDKPWDVAAIKIIVEEAGGKATDLKGGEQRYDRNVLGFVASNGLVHDEFLSLIRPLLL